MSPSPETRWWWIRHAPVDWMGKKIYGHADLDADVSDAAPLAALAPRLPRDAVVVTSHLARTEQTRAALAEHGAALGGAVALEALAEQAFGAWEGRTWDELEAEGDPLLKAFWADPCFTAPPEGESFFEMTRRVGREIVRLSEAHAGRDIVAVAHAGTIKAALALAMGLEQAPERTFAFHIAPVSLTRIDRLGDFWRIGSVGVL